MKTHRSRWPGPVYFLLLSIIACGSQSSPAPGCSSSPFMGGCFGTTIIQDLAVDPALSCLDVSVNNCNGGVIDVRNDCADPLTVQDVRVPPSGQATLDVLPADGGHTPVEIFSNFSEYEPDTDQHIILTGSLGNHPLTITFTKTAPLCDP